MTWLLRLYPSPWRRRYGGEVAALLADRAFSLRGAVDLIAGAIDMWLHPSLFAHPMGGGGTLAAASAAEPHEHTKEEKTMLNRIMRLDCAGAGGPKVDTADSWRAASVMIGCTLVLTGVWTAAHLRFRDNPYVDAVGTMPFFIGVLVSMRYTYLKGRPASVQVVFIGGFTLLLTLFFLATGWLNTRI